MIFDKTDDNCTFLRGIALQKLVFMKNILNEWICQINLLVNYYDQCYLSQS